MRGKTHLNWEIGAISLFLLFGSEENMENTRFIKNPKFIAVNVLTLMRFLLSIGFVCMILFIEESVVGIYLGIFAGIALSDYLDGKLARKWRVSSGFGSVFDLFADAFFVLASSTAFYSRGMLPFWIILVMIFKLLEFIVTSKWLNLIGFSSSDEPKVFYYDVFGRVVAACFYGVPIMTVLLAEHCTRMQFYLMTSYFLFMLSVLALISSFGRWYHCFCYFKSFKNSKSVEKE